MTSTYTIEWTDGMGYLNMGEFPSLEEAQKNASKAYREYLDQGGKPCAGQWYIMKDREFIKQQLRFWE